MKNFFLFHKKIYLIFRNFILLLKQDLFWRGCERVGERSLKKKKNKELLAITLSYPLYMTTVCSIYNSNNNRNKNMEFIKKDKHIHSYTYGGGKKKNIEGYVWKCSCMWTCVSHMFCVKEDTRFHLISLLEYKFVTIKYKKKRKTKIQQIYKKKKEKY